MIILQKGKEEKNMKNLFMKILNYFKTIDAVYSEMPCHYDFDMYCWY